MYKNLTRLTASHLPEACRSLAPVTIKPHFQTLILESLVACCEPFPECTYSVQMALFTLFIIKDMQLMQRDKYINS